eukprot:NODE_110_length_2094_cov_248.993154_g83_i0.p1 GENE.NODE_110_length_2094_cov_248.993154_g83_i0~~NODE_110_length_2094_cov_248.993154_g83_i0.p1  ORF type:complete len:245 (-),score=37.15 NODE_110_length_2094_cov_248.993154_g83_i0:640-1374(-)
MAVPPPPPPPIAVLPPPPLCGRKPAWWDAPAASHVTVFDGQAAVVCGHGRGWYEGEACTWAEDDSGEEEEDKSSRRRRDKVDYTNEMCGRYIPGFSVPMSDKDRKKVKRWLKEAKASEIGLTGKPSKEIPLQSVTSAGPSAAAQAAQAEAAFMAENIRRQKESSGTSCSQGSAGSDGVPCPAAAATIPASSWPGASWNGHEFSRAHGIRSNGWSWHSRRPWAPSWHGSPHDGPKDDDARPPSWL